MRVAHPFLGLGRTFERIRLLQSLYGQMCAQYGQTVMEGARGFVRGNRNCFPQQHISRVQAGVHLHDGDAAVAVTRFDGAVNGRSPTPARQQRGVNVDGSQSWQVQHPLRQ